MPRAKGTLNKRSEELKHELVDKHNFDVVGEIVMLYNYDKAIVEDAGKKMADNIANDRPINFNFTRDQIELYNAANKSCNTKLLYMLAYMYPKLKSMEVSSGTGDKVIFNINTAPDIVLEKSRPAKVIPIGGQHG